LTHSHNTARDGIHHHHDAMHAILMQALSGTPGSEQG
jgi:hypothetical protein